MIPRFCDEAQMDPLGQRAVSGPSALGEKVNVCISRHHRQGFAHDVGARFPVPPIKKDRPGDSPSLAKEGNPADLPLADADGVRGPQQHQHVQPGAMVADHQVATS